LSIDHIELKEQNPNIAETGEGILEAGRPFVKRFSWRSGSRSSRRQHHREGEIAYWLESPLSFAEAAGSRRIPLSSEEPSRHE
jgi:hypothetical protein